MAVLPRASNKVVCFMVRFKDTLTLTNPDFFETAHVFTRIDPPYTHESSECGHRNYIVLKLLTGGLVWKNVRFQKCPDSPERERFPWGYRFTPVINRV